MRTIKSSSLLLSSLVAMMIAVPLSSYASILVIKNDDSANIDLIIEPGEGTITGSSHQIKDTVKPKQQKTIEVTKDNLGNAEIFSIKGRVTMPSMYNKCGGLFVDQDYKIVFVGSKAGGTVCYAEPIEKSARK